MLINGIALSPTFAVAPTRSILRYARWHPEQLSEELGDPKLGEFDLGLTAFEPDQVEKFPGDLGLNGRTDPGGVPEVPNQPAGSSPGAQ